MNVWHSAILRIVASHGGTVALQQIYRSLQSGTFMRLSQDHHKETQWGGRPAYQHQVRSHISDLVQAGDLTRVSRGVYAITEKGRKRRR